MSQSGGQDGDDCLGTVVIGVGSWSAVSESGREIDSESEACRAEDNIGSPVNIYLRSFSHFVSCIHFVLFTLFTSYIHFVCFVTFGLQKLVTCISVSCIHFVDSEVT